MSKKKKIMMGIVVVIAVLVTSIGVRTWLERTLKGAPTPPISPIQVATTLDDDCNIHIAFPRNLYIKTDSNGTLINKHGTFNLRPFSAAIAVDKKNNTHIVSDGKYFKFNNNFTLEIEKPLTDKMYYGCKLRVDDEEKVHIAICKDASNESYYGLSTYYMMIKEGDITVEREIGPTHLEQFYLLPSCIEIDSKGNTHIFHSDRYIIINQNGTIVERTLNIFLPMLSVIDREDVIYVFSTIRGPPTYWKVCDEKIVYTGYLGSGLYISSTIDSKGNVYLASTTYFIKITPNGTVYDPVSIPTSRTSLLPDIDIDSNDHVYVTYYDPLTFAIYLVKFDENGNVLLPEKKVYEYHVSAEADSAHEAEVEVVEVGNYTWYVREVER